MAERSSSPEGGDEAPSLPSPLPAASSTASATPSTSSATSVSSNSAAVSSELPLPLIGSVVLVSWDDNSTHEATVVQSRERRPGQLEYYVHYLAYDRRMDEWVALSRIDLEDYKKQLEGDKPDGPKSSKRTWEPTRKVTRNMKRKTEASHMGRAGTGGSQASLDAVEREYEKNTKIKHITSVYFSKYRLSAWYLSPYPEEYGKLPHLYVCEWCFKYMAHRHALLTHTCTRRCPPGREIYRKHHISMYEIDGAQEKLYCQNLCLFAKLFLDRKTLYFDVGPFMFYVLTHVDDTGAHVVGYFSKEKESHENNNLACICTFPPYQQRGYGRFLIEFSYVLSRLEGRIGGPEKPLSDLGLIGYQSYWAWELLTALHKTDEPVTTAQLSARTGITQDDVVATLQWLDLIKYWRGHHTICYTTKQLHAATVMRKLRPPKLEVDTRCLRWCPPTAPPKEERAAGGDDA
ncbi:hypothetical protein PTSG_03996 [Salpingoeca rosetta]|uniref:Histone acetyltransferase n=1 Tax=Salpingoeca rosetta (strain ATCC 50818 / BSB-021) TaxID=946362 RepID=F2U7H2_SALR5|nr:uncharacterized protein PTSG_03996 [Salpingoeca rosetta]EGD83389.1 hypothetical protein PTSG_03996 [Salpingoeca rosetta]|eukprot:XP_004994893.1 hypothetical protein PTSG_03996 [Salpingoeca rosetta]